MDCFGDSDEDEEVHDTDHGTTASTRDTSAPHGGGKEALMTQATPPSPPPSLPLHPNRPPSLFLTYPPIYYGPLDVSYFTLDLVGAGRGYVASEDLSPGTLLLVEEPVIQWTDVHLTEELLEIIDAALDNDGEEKPLGKAIGELHPTSLDKVFKEDKEVALRKTAGHVEKAQCLLAIEHNAFGSGLFLHLSIFNHSATANCVAVSIADKSMKVTEVWVTRFVKAGEELFINYLHPPEILHETATLILQRQHRFVPLPPPSQLEALATSDIDAGKQFASKLEKLLEATEIKLQSLDKLRRNAQKSEKIMIVDEAVSIFTELTGFYERLDDNLAKTHVLRRRLYASLARAAETGDIGGTGSTFNWGSENKVSPTCSAMCAALRYYLKELAYVDSSPYLGPLHRDAALLCDAVSSSLQRILAMSSRAAVLKSFPDMTAWQKGGNAAIPMFEREIRERAKGLRTLYDSRRYFEH